MLLFLGPADKMESVLSLSCPQLKLYLSSCSPNVLDYIKIRLLIRTRHSLLTYFAVYFQILYPPWRNLFIPVFLNCWLAKSALENMLVNKRYFSKSDTVVHKLLVSAREVII